MLEIKTLSDKRFLDIELLENCRIPESAEPHRHEYFEIFWTLEGEGSHSIDFLDYPLQAGNIYFITPGQVHHCTALPKRMYAISFNSSLLGTDTRSQSLLDKIFFQNRSEHPSIVVDTQGEQDLRHLLTILQQELQNDTTDNELLNLLFSGFLRYVARYQPATSDARGDNSRMLQLLSLIDNHYTEHKHAVFYADKLALSSKRVNELSQHFLSKTVTQLIHEKTITEARRLLAFSNRSIKTIAAELGYKDSAYFCRFFKKATQESPLEFRHKWHGVSFRSEVK